MSLALPSRPVSSASAPTSRSSSINTPPPNDADVLITGNLSKPRSFRRTASGLVDCNRVLNKVFGYTSYKGQQKEIVEAAVRGADVLVVAPTGMGKSLCFQIPAIADKYGVSIVVSPLLALMSNQVAALRQRDVQVASLCSDTSQSEKAQIAKDLASGHPRTRLLYITPEKLSSKEFSVLMDKVYRNGQVMRLVVDEAHCISEWGWDFRPEYRLLGRFRDDYPDVPIMALTASATASVQNDIVGSLKMSEEHLLRVVHPFNRSNLFYEVKYVANPQPHLLMQDIANYIQKLTTKRGRASCGIIYCLRRDSCNEVAGYLRRKGISAKPYHRGVDTRTLATTLQDWLDDKVEVVVATVAFGMGIDKSDVRYILHYDLPKSFEGYYQETGRAGRDGSASKCILYYSREGAVRVRGFVAKDLQARTKRGGAPTASQRAPRSVEKLIEMAESTKICRHVLICRYFGEVIDDKDKDAVKSYCDNMCDVCKYPSKVKERIKELSSKDYVQTQSSRIEEEAILEEPEEEEAPVPVKSEPRPTKDGWRTRMLEDATESDSDESGAIKELVPLQPKLPFFPKVFKPPALAEQRESAPVSARAGSSNPNNAHQSRKRTRSPLMEMELNGPEDVQKRSRITPPDSLPPRNTVGAPRTLVRNSSRPAFRPPFAKPPTQENRPRDDTPTTGSSETWDLTRDNSRSPTSEDTVASAPAEQPFDVRDKGKGRAIDCPPAPSARKDKGKGRAVHDVQRRSTGLSRGMEHKAGEESWVPASDMMVFIGRVEASFSKKIPEQMRDGAATAIVRLLGHVMLMFSGRDELWRKVGQPEGDREERRKILQQCAKEVEFDMFSLASTAAGYNARLPAREAGLRLMRDASSPAWTNGPERDEITVEARSIVATLRNICSAR